jgi:hypothetical protein
MFVHASAGLGLAARTSRRASRIVRVCLWVLCVLVFFPTSPFRRASSFPSAALGSCQNASPLSTFGIICDPPASHLPCRPSARPPPRGKASSVDRGLPDRHCQTSLFRTRSGSVSPVSWAALARRPLPTISAPQSACLSMQTSSSRFAARWSCWSVLALTQIQIPKMPCSIFWHHVHSLSWSRPTAHCRLIAAFMRHGSISDGSFPRGPWS